MASPITPTTHRATFDIGDEPTARRVVDLLNESLDDDQAALAAFERADGRWDISAHFAEPPDQASIRELVALAAGNDVAQHIAFDTVEAKDWVKASLEDLVPVPAGRFIVHGAHDRARVPPNRLGIEIEAALAFGTGHHGTTRGCLLLLGEVLRARQPRRVLDLGTGTGVLAIAAAKALRRRVLASDIDPVSVHVARDNARLNGVGNLVEAICATGFSAAAIRNPRAVRSGAGEYPRQSVAANGDADGRAFGAIGVRDSLGAAAASGPRRHRVISRARTDFTSASQNRWLEQPADAACCVRSVGRFLFGASDDALVVAGVLLDARFDKTVQDLNDQSALLFHDGRNRSAADRRRYLLERKCRHL